MKLKVLSESQKYIVMYGGRYLAFNHYVSGDNHYWTYRRSSAYEMDKKQANYWFKRLNVPNNPEHHSGVYPADDRENKFVCLSFKLGQQVLATYARTRDFEIYEDSLELSPLDENGEPNVKLIKYLVDLGHNAIYTSDTNSLGVWVDFEEDIIMQMARLYAKQGYFDDKLDFKYSREDFENPDPNKGPYGGEKAYTYGLNKARVNYGDELAGNMPFDDPDFIKWTIEIEACVLVLKKENIVGIK